jgi:N-acetylmuramoyl-L-alanine amidase
MIRKVFCGAIAAGLLALGLSSIAAAGELRSVVLSATGDSAQLTLDLTDVTTQRLFTLEGPDRAVIDLPHTHRARGVRAPDPAGIVSAVRFGARPGGTLRIVVQMKSPLPAHSHWGAAASGSLLVVSLGEGTAAPLAARAPVAPLVADLNPRPLRLAHAPGEGDRDIIVAVDAGHGGVDPGAIGRGGTREKDVTLAIARALAARIDGEPGMRAVLTRDRDVFLDLRERMRRAHAAHADMFISVHADSITDRSISGASVYVLSEHGATSEAARVLAERENSADLMGGVLKDEGALEPVLIDAAQQEIIGISATAAQRVVAALESVGDVRRPQVQQAGFVVLKSPEIPSMLVETAYISNPMDERRLRDPAQQAKLADAICDGIRSFFTLNPPDGTRFKQAHRLATAANQTATAPPAAAGAGTP